MNQDHDQTLQRRQTTRRNFLLLTGGGVAATAGAAALAPAGLLARAPGRPLDSGGPLVAYVRDVGHGQISLLSGDREVVIRDRELAARLWQALG